MKIVKIMVIPLLIFFALICIIMGIDSISSGIRGIGEVKVLHGKLNVVEDAKDEAMGLDHLGPVLVRKTEMYQYEEVSTEDSESFEREGFFDRQMTSFQTRKGRYENPKFPEEFKSETFYGKVTFGDKQYPMTKYILSRFIAPQANMISKDLVPAEPLTENISKTAKQYHLRPVGNGTYCTRNDDNWEIGDLRITYEMVDPSILGNEYTAVVDRISDNKLGADENDVNYLYDRRVNMDQIKADYKTLHKTDGLLFLGIALVLILISLGMFFFLH